MQYAWREPPNIIFLFATPAHDRPRNERELREVVEANKAYARSIMSVIEQKKPRDGAR